MNFCFTTPVYRTFHTGRQTSGPDCAAGTQQRRATHLLLANLAISALARRFFERLDSALEDVAKCARVRNDVVELL